MHIDEGPSAVRALPFEGGKFSLQSLGAGRPLKIAEHFSRINDGRAHRGAHRRVDVHTAIECSDFSEFGMIAFLLFFDTLLANPPLGHHTYCSATLGGLRRRPPPLFPSSLNIAASRHCYAQRHP